LFMTKEDKALVFLKLRGGSGPIDTIREAADIREAAVLRQSNPLAERLVAKGLLTHPRRNHYVLTARGAARAKRAPGTMSVPNGPSSPRRHRASPAFSSSSDATGRATMGGWPI
jgi:hypothetical protein